jgi:hypothetical protein
MLQPIGTAFAAAFARRTIYLTKVRAYIFPAIKISDVDQPRNLAKSVTAEWRFRSDVVVRKTTIIVDILLL